MEKNHDTNVKATKLTWAKKCDGFIAFSTKKDPTIPSVNITHEGNFFNASVVFLITVHQSDLRYSSRRGELRQHVAEVPQHMEVHRHALHDLVRLLPAGRRRHVLHHRESEGLPQQPGDTKPPERAKWSTNTTAITKPTRCISVYMYVCMYGCGCVGLYIGRIFQPPNQIVFNSGGAGYTLDSKALKVSQILAFVHALHTYICTLMRCFIIMQNQILQDNIDTPKCFPHQHG